MENDVLVELLDAQRGAGLDSEPPGDINGEDDASIGRSRGEQAISLGHPAFAVPFPVGHGFIVAEKGKMDSVSPVRQRRHALSRRTTARYTPPS
jgi:hypothetical protein